MDSYNKQKIKNDSITIIKILISIVGFIVIVGLILFLFLSRNSGDYGTFYKDMNIKIGKEYLINENNKVIVDLLINSHNHNSICNDNDSLFLVYLYDNNHIDFSVLIDIKPLSDKQTKIKFDSVIGYSIPAFYNSIQERSFISQYDSVRLIGLFDSLVIKKLVDKTIVDKSIRIEKYKTNN